MTFINVDMINQKSSNQTASYSKNFIETLSVLEAEKE
jgi:hypothetical protein